MKRIKFKRNSEGPISDGELYDDAVGKASADYYERCWKTRIKVQRLDIWIAVGLYLVFSSIAFVVLF